MTTETKNAPSDPLGLEALSRLIEAARTDPSALDRAARALERTQERYTAMKDRYRLLKASSRQLAEETAWLRDQCDDFLMEQEVLSEDEQ